MDAGYLGVGEELFGLHAAPLDSDLLDGVVVFGVEDGFGEVVGEVDVEGAGDIDELLLGGDGLEAGYDGYGDAFFTAGFDKLEIFLVVVKHLCDDVLCACVDLVFEVLEVGLEIGCFEMLLGIACYADAEVGRIAIAEVVLEVDTFVHIADLAHEVDGVLMAALLGCEDGLALHGVATQGEYIVHAEEAEVDEGVFSGVFGESTADEVWNGFYLVLIHNSGADAYGARSLTEDYFFKALVSSFFVNVFRAMISDIDEGWLKLHEWIEYIEDGVYALAFEWGQYFKGNMSLVFL